MAQNTRFGRRRRGELDDAAARRTRRRRRAALRARRSPASAAARRPPCCRRRRRARAARSRNVDVEDRRALRPRRQLVGGRAAGRERARASSHSSSSIVSQPTPWMKPPSIWPRSTIGESESPTSCRMSARSSAVLAGEAVDLDLGHRGAVGEVVERLAVARLRDRSGCPACGRSPCANSGTRCW